MFGDDGQHSPGENSHYTLGHRVTAAGCVRPYQRQHTDPLYRPLQIYTLDPSSSKLQGAVTTVQVPYEPLRPGPCGSLLEIIDGEESTPLNLEDPRILIQNGRQPSPGDHSFHHQMVYAVVSLTYAAFQRALGRQLVWGFSREGDDMTSRLTVYPHAGEGRDAFYNADAGTLSFGFYRADEKATGRNRPGGRVYTCLSHDIIVHETTHALLDGLRAHFRVCTNPDVKAFHEAFADLIAILQHFSYGDVVRCAMRESRGKLRAATLLTDIARQFGHTTQAEHPLRSPIDIRGEDEKPLQYANASDEPHERGTVLTSAVFDAFMTIFERKTAPFFRLATGGTGELPSGELPADLLDLLAKTAQTLAKQFLNICIRAIDYCPPVDIEFGEYLRAVITADYDLVAEDPWGYREAWIDAFARRGIYPPEMDHLSEEEIRWKMPERTLPVLHDLCFGRLQFDKDPAQPAGPAELRRQACALGWAVVQPEWIEEYGCVRPNDPRLRGDRVELPCVESVRTARRVGPDGQMLFDLVAEVVQKRCISRADGGGPVEFYGGATVILDPTGKVRYVLRKSVLAAGRVGRQPKDIRGEIDS